MPTLFVATESALAVVADARGDPSLDRRLRGADPECVAVHPDEPRRVFCGTFESGLRRSNDGGDSWERVSADGIDESAVTSLATHPDDPATLFAGTEPSAVYRSTDGGDAWTRLDGLRELPSEPEWSFPPRPYTHHARWIAVDPYDPDHLEVSIEAGALVRTHDGGATWEDRTSTARRDNHTIATHPEAPGRLWAAAGDGYAESHDGGDSWTYPQAGLDHRYCWSVAVDAAEPDTVLVSAASGAGSAHRPPGEAYLYRKSGSDPWERLDDRGLPTGEGALRAVLHRGEEGGEFWAANNHGVFHTTSAGDEWTALDVDWPEAFADETVRGLALVT